MRRLVQWGLGAEALRSYSLVGVGDGIITFHRLVQAATRDGLPADDRRRWTEVALRLVNAALPRPPWEHTNWQVIGAILPHALATADTAELRGNGASRGGLHRAPDGPSLET